MKVGAKVDMRAFVWAAEMAVKMAVLMAAWMVAWKVDEMVVILDTLKAYY